MQVHRLKLIQSLVILTSVVGLSAVTSLSVAQTPNPDQSPSVPNPGEPSIGEPGPGPGSTPGASPSPVPDRPSTGTTPSPSPVPDVPNPGGPSLGEPGPGPGGPPGNTLPGASPSPSPTTPTPTPTTRPAPSPTPTTRPAPSPAPVAPSTQSLGELLQQASGAGSYRTLARIVQETGVGDTLRAQGGSFTILAPTDEAFNRLPAGTLDRLLRPENRALLGRILAYHVIPGELTSSQLRTGGVDTLAGGIAIRVTPERIIVNDGSVVQPNIQAANGVVHGINTVLMPRQLRQQVLNLR